MSADPRVPIDDLRAIAAEFKAIERRLDMLETPTGTSVYQTVSKLQALVDDIQTQLDQYMSTRYTNAQVDALIDQKVAAAIAAAFAGNVSITGSLTVNGALAAASLSTGGSLTAGGAVNLPDVFNTNVVGLGGARKTVWVREGGRMGNTA